MTPNCVNQITIVPVNTAYCSHVLALVYIVSSQPCVLAPGTVDNVTTLFVNDVLKCIIHVSVGPYH